jgi:2-oxoisovalerate dehydrogenase E1 component alpha subunit
MDQLDSVVQLLDSDGSVVNDARYQSTLDESALLGLYRDMVLVRQLDEQATALQRQGELGLWAPLLGQEAAQIGSGRAMEAQDYAFSTYREHGVAWCRGVDPVDMLRFWRGTQHQAWDANLHRMYGYQIIIGAHALHATGYAMGARLAGRVGTGESGRDQAVVAYFGDGAMSEGDVNEAFVFACHAVTVAALNRARSGHGPTLIEAVTYRMGAHTTSDEPTKYRDAAEVELWRGRDPLDRLRIHLRAKGILDDDLQSGLTQEAESLANRMREGCRELPDPQPLSMFDHVYAGSDTRLDDQRREVETILSAERES